MVGGWWWSCAISLSLTFSLSLSLSLSLLSLSLSLYLSPSISPSQHAGLCGEAPPLLCCFVAFRGTSTIEVRRGERCGGRGGGSGGHLSSIILLNLAALTLSLPLVLSPSISLPLSQDLVAAMTMPRKPDCPGV